MKDRFVKWFKTDGVWLLFGYICLGLGILLGWGFWGYTPQDDTAQTTVMVDVDTKTLEDYGYYDIDNLPDDAFEREMIARAIDAFKGIDADIKIEYGYDENGYQHNIKVSIYWERDSE